MYVLVTYKNEEDQMKSQNIIQLYFRHSRAGNSEVAGQVWPKIKLIQAFIVVLDTCKNDQDPSKNALECSQTFSFYKSMEIFQTFKGS